VKRADCLVLKSASFGKERVHKPRRPERVKVERRRADRKKNQGGREPQHVRGVIARVGNAGRKYLRRLEGDEDTAGKKIYEERPTKNL